MSRFDNHATLNSYVEHAQPLIGWPGKTKVNHFMLINELAVAKPEYQQALAKLVSRPRLTRVQRVATEEFGGLLSPERRDLINRCLDIRFTLFADAVGVQL